MTDNPALKDFSARLGDAVERSRYWLINRAAPLWSERGWMPVGLFAERMTLTGVPDASYFRTFVQARHVYSFCAAGALGWCGPWANQVGETVDMLLARARRDDGFFVHRLNEKAEVLDGRSDLYDQAFMLFALGVAGQALGRTDLFDAAEALLYTIEANWSHPNGGFTEGEIVDASLRRQNPHMHLFEAALTLAEGSGRERFFALASTIATLAADKLIDPSSGALLEYFDENWQPAAGVTGAIAEPGHCFEWAWLFERMAASGWERGIQISDGLTAFARNSGIDHTRGVAINEVLIDGTVHNASARLWPQTERIKAAVARYRRSGDAIEAKEVSDALRGLELYYDVPVAGLWRDKLLPDGTWVEELAPGSSLYHISCAYRELATLV